MFFQNAGCKLYLMVKLRHLKKIHDRSCTPRFRIHASYYDSLYAGLHKSAGTHLARFQRHIHLRACR